MTTSLDTLIKSVVFFLATCFVVKSRNRDAHFHLIPYNMEGPRYTEPVLLFVFNNIFAYKIWGSDIDK